MSILVHLGGERLSGMAAFRIYVCAPNKGMSFFFQGREYVVEMVVEKRRDIIVFAEERAPAES